MGGEKEEDEEFDKLEEKEGGEGDEEGEELDVGEELKMLDEKYGHLIREEILGEFRQQRTELK